MSGRGGHEPTNHLWILHRLGHQNNDAKSLYASYCKQRLDGIPNYLIQQVANETSVKADLWQAKREFDLAKQKLDQHMGRVRALDNLLGDSTSNDFRKKARTSL